MTALNAERSGVVRGPSACPDGAEQRSPSGLALNAERSGVVPGHVLALMAQSNEVRQGLP
ncbi:MAG: hypothetical protein R3301_03100 [Saprospiraceae bacterium]|nr:hypothetical protein [Saprospiraceae bacterium]